MSKRFIPYLVALATFVIVTLIQFAPLFKGKVINQQDIVQHRGMSKEVVDYRNTHHEEALWTNSMFGGMPAYQVSPVYSGNWLGAIDRCFHLFIPHPGGYMFMYFLGFFILLLCLDIDPWLAFAGSLAYGFSSYFYIILEVGHNSKANAIGYLAPLMGGLLLLLRGRYLPGFLLSLLFLALELNANHVQIAYYGMMLLGLVVFTYFFLALRNAALPQFFKALALFLLTVPLAILPNAGNLLATWEYGQYSTRGKTELTIGPDLKPNRSNVTSGLDKDYAVQYSHGVAETFALMIPNYKGGPSGIPIAYANKDALKQVDPELREDVGQMSTYFGVQGTTAGPVYLGAFVVLLALMGLLISDHPLKWPLLVATLLSMMLSWGKHFMDLSAFFLDYFPGYNKFRAVSMILVIAELTVPLLALLGLDRFVRLVNEGDVGSLRLLGKPLTPRRSLFIALALAGGFCLLGWLAPQLVNDFNKPFEEERLKQAYLDSGGSAAQVSEQLPQLMINLEKARVAVFRADALRSLIFTVAGAVLLYLFQLQRLKKVWLAAALAVLFTADLWPVATRYLNARSFVPRAQFEAPPEKSEADVQILSDSALDFRVANLSVMPFQDATTSYYHKSIGGYHGAKLKKYDELISFHLFGELNTLGTGLRRGGDPLLIDSLTHLLPVLNMLNTRYFIVPTAQSQVALLNPNANGNAWFVSEVKTVANADSEMVALYRCSTRTQAVVQAKHRPAGIADHYSAQGLIRLVAYAPNRLVYTSKSDQRQFAVFSEIWYPKGWDAFIDGQPLNYLCVDYLLRGAEIPAGEHRIEFRFQPSIYKTGNTLSLIGSLLLLAVLGGGLWWWWRTRRSHSAQTF